MIVGTGVLVGGRGVAVAGRGLAVAVAGCPGPGPELTLFVVLTSGDVEVGASVDVGRMVRVGVAVGAGTLQASRAFTPDE